MSHVHLLAAEYRHRAATEASAGAASPLGQVRDKHERAALAWSQLADAADAREADQAARRAGAEARAAAAG